MNIFEILSAGNRVLKEEHISAVLGWLLDPYHDHGLGMELLKRIASEYFPQTEIDATLKVGEFSGLVMRERAKLPVVTELEHTVGKDEGKVRSIDILVRLPEQRILLAIESKTSIGSHENSQLQEEVEGLKAEFTDPKIFVIYLTPPKIEDRVKEAIQLVPEGLAAPVVHVLWQTGNEAGTKSMADILTDILVAESIGKVSPLSGETRFLLKSFVRFIENGFTFTQGQPLVSGTYFDGYLQGFEGILEYAKTKSGVLIGFTTGLDGLEAQLTATALDEEALKDLVNRRYKWVSSTNPAKRNKANWIPIPDFVAALERHGLI